MLMIMCIDSVQTAAIDETRPAFLILLFGTIAKQEPTSVSIEDITVASKQRNSTTAANV